MTRTLLKLLAKCNVCVTGSYIENNFKILKNLLQNLKYFKSTLNGQISIRPLF